MVTYQQLNDLRLGKLKEAVADWKWMAEKLGKLADGGDGDASSADLDSKAKSADWAGKNATVTKEFVTKTASEFKDTHAAAKNIHTILDGAHTKLQKHKQDLRDVVDKAPKNIHVDAKGVVRAREGADPQPKQAEIDAVVADLEAVLKAAAETDSTAAGALRFFAADKYDFNATGFSSFDAAQKSIKDSNEAVELAKKDPAKLTNTELNRLNTLLKENGSEPVFAERVATTLGPERTMKFFAGAVDMEAWRAGAGSRGQGTEEERMKLLGTLEKELGGTLGTASRSESTAMDSWKDRAVDLGPQTVGGTEHHKNIRGFQVMSNLMRHGKYEGGFLNDYGNALVKYEKENTGDVRDPGPGGQERKNVLPWDKMPSYSKAGPLHPGDDNDAGTDPMTGFMQGLSHNPDAATDFFSAKEPQDNSQWVLKDRPAFNDVVADGYGESRDDYEGPKAVYEATGDALVAGATGQDPDNPQPNPPDHTPQQRAVLENSLAHLSARGDDFPGELRDDMAKVLISHGDTVHQTMGGAGGDRPLDEQQLMEVSKQVSRDQNAYGMLNEGMNYAMVKDFHTETANPEDSLDRAGRTVGFLEEARYQAIGDKTGAELEDLGWKKNWTYHGLGTAASFIPGVGGIVDRGAFMVTTDWQENETHRINDAATSDNQETYRQRKSHLDSLADRWYEDNSGCAQGETGYSRDQGVYSKIEASANDGNHKAEGIAGDKE